MNEKARKQARKMIIIIEIIIQTTKKEKKHSKTDVPTKLILYIRCETFVHDRMAAH